MEMECPWNYQIISIYNLVIMANHEVFANISDQNGGVVREREVLNELWKLEFLARHVLVGGLVAINFMFPLILGF